jgi:glycosyltransferase involved in cell wall biosynthesis
MFASVIVSTYNKPEYLNKALEALAHQTTKSYEVVVADDGSGEETRRVVERWQKSFPVALKHAWIEDKGFRAGTARNAGVRLSKGDYLIFLDGDCVAPKDFIEQHFALAEKGKIVAGNRALLSKEFTEEVIREDLRIQEFPLSRWKEELAKKHINRLAPLKRTPFYFLFRGIGSKKWEKIRTCNLGVWRSDFEKVNGFDEGYVGWGYEDSDLGVRLLRSGLKRKSGNYAVGVIHLFHFEGKRKQEGATWERFQMCLKGDYTFAQDGLNKGGNGL